MQLDVDRGVLQVVVTDDGTGAPKSGGSRGGGHGLVGMRERVAVYGGSLDVGPGDDGGYRVTATLPYDDEVVAVIRVVVADDQALVRSGFTVLLNSADDIEVVGEANDGEEAVDRRRPRAARRHPHGHPHAGHRRPRGHPAHHCR